MTPVQRSALNSGSCVDTFSFPAAQPLHNVDILRMSTLPDRRLIGFESGRRFKMHAEIRNNHKLLRKCHQSPLNVTI